MHSQSFNKEAPSHLRSSSYQKLSSHLASLLETPRLTTQNLVHTQEIFDFIDREVQQCNTKLHSQRNSADFQQPQPSLGNLQTEAAKGKVNHGRSGELLVSQGPAQPQRLETG